MAAGHSDNPLSHVIDHDTLELPWFNHERMLELHLPNVLGFQVTRFMVMEVVAALLVILIVVPLARHVARNPFTRGGLMNAFEAMIFFIRDGVARPAIDAHGPNAHGPHDHGHGEHVPHLHEHGAVDGTGHHFDTGGFLGVGPGEHHSPRFAGRSSDFFMPFLWTLFFFILFCNLLGMFPGGASATANINVTGPLAVITLVFVFIAGFRAMGVAGFFVGIVPRWRFPSS